MADWINKAKRDIEKIKKQIKSVEKKGLECPLSKRAVKALEKMIKMYERMFR